MKKIFLLVVSVLVVSLSYGQIKAKQITDATTIGKAVLTLTNPSAVTFNRNNANNTITPRTAAEMRVDLNVSLASDTISGETIVVMKKDSTGVALGSYVTGKALQLAIAGVSGGSGTADSIRILASPPTTGNVYQNSNTGRTWFKNEVSNYWSTPVLVADSVAVASPQNLVKYSEQLDNAVWLTSGGLTVTANQANDLNGEATLDMLDNGGGGNLIYYNITGAGITVVPGTTYRLSFEVKRGTATSLNYLVYDNTHSTAFVSTTSYYSLTNSSTPVRVSFPFTAPSGCTSIWVYLSNDQGGGTCYIGRVQVEENGSYYVTTTSTIITP